MSDALVTSLRCWPVYVCVMVKHRSLCHTKTLSAKETVEQLKFIKNPFIKCLTSSLEAAPRGLQNKLAFVASYSFGSPIAYWSEKDSLTFKLFPPCEKNAKWCPQCAEMDTACTNEMPLVLVLRNAIEVYTYMASFAKLTGQTPSLVLRHLFCSPITASVAASSVNSVWFEPMPVHDLFIAECHWVTRI
jgi:hypothetical protein